MFLASGVVIGSNVEIDDGVEIGPNTVLANCSIGAGTTIGANCSIGLPGFGYEPDESGRPLRFPHVGRVVLAKDVVIGSNTCIDRGALGNTVIGSGVRIDNLVHVAHNVEIGTNSLVIANSMIAGGVRIGSGVWVGPGSAVKDQLTLGDRSYLGLSAVVIKDVEAGTVVVGNPARVLSRKRP